MLSFCLGIARFAEPNPFFARFEDFEEVKPDVIDPGSDTSTKVSSVAAFDGFTSTRAFCKSPLHLLPRHHS